MRQLRDGSKSLLCGDVSRSRRFARKSLLLGGYVVAGWFGLSAFGSHHAAEAATVDRTADSSVTVAAPSSAPAGVLGAVTASALPGSMAADAAPSTDAVALPHLSDPTPVRDVLGAHAAPTPTGGPAPQGANLGSSTVGDLAAAVAGHSPAAIGRPVEETLTAVTAPIQSLHRTLTAPVHSTVGRVISGALPGRHPSEHSVPTHRTSTWSGPDHQTRPQPDAQTVTYGRSKTSVPASRPAATSTARYTHLPYGVGQYRVTSFPSAVHLFGATEAARGSLRVDAGIPAAPLQDPGPIPAVPGSAAVAGTSVGSPQFGSGFTGSAIPADQISTAYPAAVHTVRHDNARIARSEAAQPSCSPD